VDQVKTTKDKERKRFFFEKKKQKTSAKCEPWPGQCHSPQDQKFLVRGRLGFFSKKNPFLPYG